MDDSNDTLDGSIRPVPLEPNAPADLPREDGPTTTSSDKVPVLPMERFSKARSTPVEESLENSPVADREKHISRVDPGASSPGHVEKLREIIAYETAELEKRLELGSTSKSGRPETGKVTSSPFGVVESGFWSPVNVEGDAGATEVETGSGVEPVYDSRPTDSTVFFGNPAFVVIDHELESPDGVEGPPPVYVKPSYNFNFPKEAGSVGDNRGDDFVANQPESVTRARAGPLGEESYLATGEFSVSKTEYFFSRYMRSQYFMGSSLILRRG